VLIKCSPHIDEVRSVATVRRMFPRLLSLLLGVAILLMPLPAHAANADEVVFTGSGWGHGVGMSQYGAYGMALNGYTAPQIIEHYYTGSSVTDLSSLSVPEFIKDPEPLWIGLLQNRSALTFKVDGPEGTGATVCQGWGAGSDCSLHVKAGETWRVSVGGSGLCTFERTKPASPVVAGEPRDCDSSIRPDSQVRVTMDGYTYRSGIFRLRKVPGSNPVRFHVVLQIGIDAYLRGIAEMPTWWHAEALKAQVIAARSYLVSHTVAKGPGGNSFSFAVKQSCWCHLYDDTRSQVYKGDVLWDNANWSSAVTSTAGEVIAYNGTLVTAFYSSSSGGKTENVEDVWGGSGAPWLVSVDDHWAHISAVNNPRSSWTLVRSRQEMADALGLDVLHRAVVSKRPSGGVATVAFTGEIGGKTVTVTKSGTSVRSLFGLYSHYFSIDMENALVKTAYEISSDHEAPIGSIGVLSGQVESAHVRGWIMDPDTPLPIAAHIYVDGKFKIGLLADDSRGDVENVYGNGLYHGFDETFALSPGRHQICVYAINAPTKTNNSKIGCASVSVSSDDPPPPPPDPQPTGSTTPFGFLGKAWVEGDMLNLRGWVIDKDLPDEPVPIHVYVDGRFSFGQPSSTYRPDVDKVYGLGANHGFDTVTDIAPGSHRVCVYAINLPERTDNPLLGCQTVG
jgi:SpoIID/LytB domain protein